MMTMIIMIIVDYYFDATPDTDTSELKCGFNALIGMKIDMVTPYQVKSRDKIFDLEAKSGSDGKRGAWGFRNWTYRLHTCNIH